MPRDVPPAIQDWLDEFAHAVRSRDPGLGASILAADAVGFGTVVARYGDRDELGEQQWANVWPRTRDFRFDRVVGCWTDAAHTTVAAQWSSTDADSEAIRRGRATLVLRQVGDSVVAVHTHFSMNPGTPS